ncbi:MlaA family lipoprotein [Pseudoponticoccus marisrubri]|uniref:VacJ lipoprotein n=1 Tax=Pseudoponticoccus marisrubri TaxID=1685382 RepID=A0A0W7WK79_9RHOB|nr:VacJ family lipoprotein [Pseudoponticoccus marisrubri]KUF11010.1 VacJ lipoprotein [Pseudoponticoccus marisrubri]
MRAMRAVFAASLVSAVAACSVPGPGEAPDGIHDPYEATNRKVHAFNRNVDQAFFSGSRRETREPGPVAQDFQLLVGNFADTVSLPRTVVNQVLQGRLGAASRNTLRFSLNATLGFGGLGDFASELGLERDESDFGETLAVWGVPEGAYQTLPLIGPSTERDTAGRVVDLFTDPLSYVVPRPQRYVGTAARALDTVGERARYSGAVEDVLYDSADGYAQLRLIYLQNRRFELGEDAPGGEIDPMAIDTEGF